MEETAEKMTVPEGVNPAVESAGLFSRQEMESLVKGLGGPTWAKWLGDASETSLGDEQRLSGLSDQELQIILTQILQDMF